MRETILEKLDEIERDHDVTILFAIESGSRAWGFPSKDSDYDVRFVYARPTEWYLSIAEGRDVIEIPIDEVLDINGWDVRKALRLLRKSNMTLVEWLSSPIVYKINESKTEILKAVVPNGFDRRAVARHYLSMAKSNRFKTQNETVRLKSYLYTIRPLLCCRWVIEKGTPPPMLFRELVSEYMKDSETGKEITALIKIKETQVESDTVPRNSILDQFVTKEHVALEAMLPDKTETPDIEPFNDAFLKILKTT